MQMQMAGWSRAPLSGQRGGIIAGWLGTGRAGPLRIDDVSEATVCGGGRENVQGGKYRQGAPGQNKDTPPSWPSLDSGVDLDLSTTRISAVHLTISMNVTLAVVVRPCFQLRPLEQVTREREEGFSPTTFRTENPPTWADLLVLELDALLENVLQ